jgi:hypothetical protein
MIDRTKGWSLRSLKQFLSRNSRGWRRAKALKRAKSGVPVILFISPEAGLAPFYAGHVMLAATIRDAGHLPIMLSCNGLLPTCSVKLANQMKPTAPGDLANFSCTSCLSSAARIGDEYGLPDLALESVLTKANKEEIERIVADKQDALQTVTYDGIEIGAAALGETLRAVRKLSIDEMVTDDQVLFRAMVYASLAIYIALKMLASRLKIARIAYFGDYAYHIGPQVFASRNKMPITNISYAYNRDIDQRYLLLRPGHGITHMLEQVDRWGDYRNIPIEPAAIARIADGALYRLQGHGGVSTYSPNWVPNSEKIIKDLGLSEERRTLVAYTSSTDELICNREFMRVLGNAYEQEHGPFKDQNEWLRHLIAWVRERNDLQLIIRLHPRMVSSYRHPGVASQYSQMKQELAALPCNVAVVWAESSVSSYNIAELADVALTAWSNIGLELSRFGIPVIAAFSKIGPFPVGGFTGFASTLEGYFQAVERALVTPCSIDTVIEAYRWTYFLHWSPTIDVSDVIRKPDNNVVPPRHNLRHREALVRVLTANEDLIALNMSGLRRTSAAVEAERRAIIAAMEECAYFFITGERPLSEDVSNGSESDSRTPPICGEPADRDRLTSIARTSQRRSPLVRRLLNMISAAHIQTADKTNFPHIQSIWL